MEPTPNEGSSPTPAPRPPGNRALRVVIGIVLAVVVVWLLFTVVFPWFQEYQDDPTLEGGAARVLAAVIDDRA